MQQPQPSRKGGRPKGVIAKVYDGPPEPFNCEQCGVVVVPKRRRPGKYCSKACRNIAFAKLATNYNEAHRKTATCEHCGATRIVPLSDKNKYCNQGCYFAADAAVKTQRQCLFCGHSFTVPLTQIRASEKDGLRRGSFCSRQCAGSYCVRNRQKRSSKQEQEFVHLLNKAGVAVEAQWKIGGYTVDAAIVAKKLVIEFDGEYWHKHSATAERDRRKELYLRHHGYSIIRVTDTSFKRSKSATIKRVKQVIASTQSLLFSI